MVLAVLGRAVKHQIPVGNRPELLTVRHVESGRYGRILVVLPSGVIALLVERRRCDGNRIDRRLIHMGESATFNKGPTVFHSCGVG